MLHLRLIFGSLLALGVIALMATDAWLAAARPIPGTVGDWLCNGALCTLLLLTFSILSIRELNDLAKQRGFRPLRFVMYVFTAGMVVSPYIAYNLDAAAPVRGQSWGLFWLSIGLAVAFLLQAVRRGLENVMANLATTMFFTFYVGFLGFMVRLRMQVGGADGAILLLFSMFVVKITDVGAYFTGRMIGRHKFIPWLSPNKTWEGVVGGVIVGVLCAVLIGSWLSGAGWISRASPALLSPLALAGFGLLMAVFSVSGDLCESLLKRDAAMKDSGNMIPGMGGILDVLDSPLLAAPIAWFFWTQLPLILQSIRLL